MQSVSSRIWTRVAVSISYDDNHYTTNTSITGNMFIIMELKHFASEQNYFYPIGANQNSFLSNYYQLKFIFLPSVPIRIHFYPTIADQNSFLSHCC